MCVCVHIFVSVHMKMFVCMNLQATSGLLSIYTDVVIYEYFVCSLQSRRFPQILGERSRKVRPTCCCTMINGISEKAQLSQPPL